VPILQFGALTFIALPLLPDRAFGPQGSFNPREIWLMVVLVAGVGLVGWLLLRFAGRRYGAPLAAVAGGLVSSTATTLVFARHAKAGGGPAMAAAMVLLSNLTMLVRLALLTAIAQPRLLPGVAAVAGAGGRVAGAARAARGCGAAARGTQPHRPAGRARLRAGVRPRVAAGRGRCAAPGRRSAVRRRGGLGADRRGRDHAGGHAPARRRRHRHRYRDHGDRDRGGREPRLQGRRRARRRDRGTRARLRDRLRGDGGRDRRRGDADATGRLTAARRRPARHVPPVPSRRRP
jgi:hypothetical protein